MAIFEETYYELLGVSQSADDATLRRAFRALSKTLHPDTTKLPVRQAAERFQQVCEAYELLTDPSLRKEYDLILTSRSFQQDLSLGNTDFNKSLPQNFKSKDVRRPFSSGEVFSLLLLIIALVFSLLICLVLAYFKGNDLQVVPSWLIIQNDFGIFTSLSVSE